VSSGAGILGRERRRGVLAALMLASATGLAQAQTASPPVTLAGFDVVGETPVPGANIQRDRIAAATQVLGRGDVDRAGVPTLTGAILETVPSATINDTEGNVFQPDILFRGFTASPVAGTPQGLAVYVNGARFNDAFGDTVNWDLIAPTAVQSVDVDASNPLFGLNALGGSVNVRLKTGFTYEGGGLTAYGGSYGRAAGIVEFGREVGAFALYATVDITHDRGFRQTNASDLQRLFADLGWRGEGLELHLGLTADHDTLGNPGATPVQALDANISNIFTAPNAVDNRYFAANLNGVYRVSRAFSLQGLAYFQTLTQQVPNGTTADVAPCDNGSGLLCNDDGTYVTGPGGELVPDFLHGATYSGLSVQELVTHAYGASVQSAYDASPAGHGNHLLVGVGFDGSDSVFAGSQSIGGFNPYTREYVGPGVVQDQPSEGVNPVRVLSLTRFWGLYATDVLAVARGLELNLAGRFNDAQIDLEDELGGPVSGRHDYSRLDPAAGLTWRAAAWLQVYGRYAETNRAPTPEELSCSSPATPCSLLNFFVGDPNLDQVVAHTVEAGARGSSASVAGGRMSWSLDAYRTENTNDIIYESTPYNPNLAFYTNAGRTLRQGVEVSVRYDGPRLHASLGYALTDATFRTPLLLDSGSNPAADPAGQIEVEPGDRIPGVPRHRGTLVVDYTLTPCLTLGGSVIGQSDAFRFGDEANLTKSVGGYAVVDLNAAFRATDRITLFGLIDNAFNARFDTYGSFGPVSAVPWPNVPGDVTDTRTASPGAPIAGYGGVRVTF